jgi:CBS domain containing-hemolysin-like protein
MFAIIATVTISLMILATALYVAAEFATVAARRTRISQLAAEGNRTAQTLLPFLEDSKALDRYVAACQVGITISSLILGAYAQSAFAERLVEPLSLLLARVGQAATPDTAVAAAQTISVILVLAAVTTLQVVLGELLPKSVAIQFPERVALAVMWPMLISLKLFMPLIWIFNGSATLLLRLLGQTAEGTSGRAHSPEEIELLVTESHEGGLLDDNERRMLRNAFRLRDLTARQVMIHRTKILAAPLNVSVDELLQLTIQAGISRIPLYRETIDDIVGFVHVKDVFRLHVQGRQDVQSVMRHVHFVPETLPVEDVWRQLSIGGQYLAIAFDEFGGTAGLITFEDLVEEIFGELQDEFDDEMATVARDKEGRVYLRGDLLVTDVNEYLELDLPVEAADTLGGLIFSELGHLPQEGEEVQFGTTVIRVEKTEDFSVREVSLLLPPGEEGDDAELPFIEWEIGEHD